MEHINGAVYQDGRGCRNVPLLPILQRFLDVMETLKPDIICTLKGCYEHIINVDKLLHFDSISIHNDNGY